MSEFHSLESPGVVRFKKLGDGRVFDTTSRFQLACPGSNQPARSPIRGSGLGGDVDMSTAGDGADPAVEDDDAHAAAERTPTASDSETIDTDLIETSIYGVGGASMRRMRLISVVWSTPTSFANLKMSPS